MTDYSVGDTFDVKFSTRSFSTGAPTTLAGTPVVSAYPGNSTTQITAGITLTVDFDSVTGLHNVRVVATTGNGYASGSTYYLVITTGTVGGVSVVGEVIGEFTLGRSAAAVRVGTLATSASTGDPGTTTTLVAYLKQLVNILAGTAGITTFPAEAAPGNAVSLAEVIRAIHADVTGLNGATVDSIADGVWDEVLTGGTHNVTNSAGRRLRALQDFAGYALGAIWIDTVGGTAGTTDFENGTVNNPVDTLADAITLSTSLNITRFMVAAGSSITLASAATNYEFMGQNWTLAFGGQSIANAKINGATVSGTFTGTTGILEDCIINAITGPGITMRRCFFNDITMTADGAGDWFLNDCKSRVAGSGSPNFDFGALVGNTGLSMRNYSGGIELENFGDTGTDTASIEGNGNIIINVNSGTANGTLVIRGNFDFTNNGSTTNITQTARPAYRFTQVEGATFSTSTDSLEAIRDRGDAAWTTGAGGSNPFVLQNTTIATLASQVSFTLTAGSADDDAYNGMLAIVEDSATATQKCVGVISDYTGSTRTVTLREDPGVFTMAVGDTIDVVAVSPDVLDILADTGELQGDWVNGGRLDLILDSRMAEASINTTGGAIDNVTLVATTTTNTDMRGTDSAATAASLATAQADLDILTGTDGVTLATSQPNYAPATAAALATTDAVVDNLNLGIIYGTAQTGTLSTTQATTDLTGYADDELIGRVIIFTGGTADGIASDITDYASASGLVTFTAIPTAPANADTFKIV